MLTIENSEVVGWEHAIRGMRNPMNSWDRSDSCTRGEVGCMNSVTILLKLNQVTSADLIPVFVSVQTTTSS